MKCCHKGQGVSNRPSLLRSIRTSETNIKMNQLTGRAKAKFSLDLDMYYFHKTERITNFTGLRGSTRLPHLNNVFTPLWLHCLNFQQSKVMTSHVQQTVLNHINHNVKGALNNYICKASIWLSLWNKTYKILKSKIFKGLTEGFKGRRYNQKSSFFFIFLL